MYRSKQHKVTVAYHRGDDHRLNDAKLQMYALDMKDPNPAYQKAVRKSQGVEEGKSISLTRELIRWLGCFWTPLSVLWYGGYPYLYP